jgi:hypothetical protein
MGTLSNNEIVMAQTTDRTIRITATKNGAPLDLTNARGVFVVKRQLDDSDAEALLTKKTVTLAGGSDEQFKVTDAAGGKAEIYIVPADTASIEPGMYTYGIKVMVTGGKQFDLVKNASFCLEPSAVQQIIPP